MISPVSNRNSCLFQYLRFSATCWSLIFGGVSNLRSSVGFSAHYRGRWREVHWHPNQLVAEPLRCWSCFRRGSRFQIQFVTYRPTYLTTACLSDSSKQPCRNRTGAGDKAVELTCGAFPRAGDGYHFAPPDWIRMVNTRQTQGYQTWQSYAPTRAIEDGEHRCAARQD